MMQPKFSTKEERAAEALKRRQAQVNAQRRVLDDERRKQEDFMKAAKESAGQLVNLFHTSSSSASRTTELFDYYY